MIGFTRSLLHVSHVHEQLPAGHAPFALTLSIGINVRFLGIEALHRFDRTLTSATCPSPAMREEVAALIP